jgi:hypothetical protein
MTFVDTAAVAAELVKDLRRKVSALEEDLRVRSDEMEESATALKAEYAEAKAAQRTAATYESWRDERVTQVAAAWVLGTVFVRYCEDNGLIAWPFIAGPGEQLADAEERHEAYFREHPNHNDRDWIIAAFDHLAAAHPTAAGLFDRRHNPLWEIPPSFEAATELLRFWRRGENRYDFTGWDTRFLGDLYQDLSEHARKTYALLQTPEFVEEFILDLTLEPAVEEFGLAGLRTIDPACGSGHFLLGIFRRLLAKWRAAEPGAELWNLIRRSLESVHGCDKNPFAVSIARFRLLVAVLQSAEVEQMDQAPDFPINIAVGDSLIHGQSIQLTMDEPHTYITEDVNKFVRSCNLLARSSYHVVVGNPPYITVKDKSENQLYRERYSASSGAYALSVPFAQRLFQLAIRTHGSQRDAGYVGQITANSFMKREFGKKLIQDFFPTVHLTHIIDTSGVYIPGHGTPTVVLVGRNHISRQSEPVRAILGIRGEPQQPDSPVKGLVWMAIVRQLMDSESESEWVSSAYIEREIIASFPWSLSGGGASDVLDAINRRGSRLLANIVDTIGFCMVTREDDAYVTGRRSALRLGIADRYVRPLCGGHSVRDWSYDEGIGAIFPYVGPGEPGIDQGAERVLWVNRVLLRLRRALSGTQEEQGLEWFEYSSFSPKRYWSERLITFPFVATHNHFALRTGQVGFIRTAPVIKLSEGASEDDHLGLLGVLNSSAACFWLKQVSHNKGRPGAEQAGADEPWEHRYEFTGTKLQDFPLPAKLPVALGKMLDVLAQELMNYQPEVVCRNSAPVRVGIDAARLEYELIRSKMIALQEELDWYAYYLYGFITESELAGLVSPSLEMMPGVTPAERASFITLARKVDCGETTTTWFSHHNHKFDPVTDIPVHWPEWYQKIVQARIDTIEKRRDLALIERPEYKRRWAIQPWEKKEAEALRTWLLDRCERRDYWFALRNGMEQPRTLTVNQLADRFRDDPDMHSVAQLYATSHLGKPDLTLAQVLDQIIADQHVPHLAALRYKDTGLRKRAQWEHVWEQQREEDRTGERLDIPVPPRYTSADFRKNSYWSQRGKLDVPKERFISYPTANPDSDPTLLLGWPGWDHADQAQALVNLINDRASEAGWETDRLTPLLAGLAEVMPWVHQWHNEYDEDWGGNPAEEFQAFLDEQRTRHQLTEADLTAWRPTPAKRGRRARKDG